MFYLKTIITLIKNKNFGLIILKLISRFNHLRDSPAYKKNSHLFDTEKFEEFIDSSNQLEKKEAVDSRFYQKKAIAYFRLDDKNQANNTMQKSLELFINEQTDYFVNQVEGIIFDPLSVKSSYGYLGGYNNLGVIIHDSISNPKSHYITKITKNDPINRHSIKKEIVFNDLIRKGNPFLEKASPAMISSIDYHHKKLKLLTFEKKGQTLIDDFDIDLNVILQLNQLVINSTKYDDTHHLLKHKHLEKFLNPMMKMHEKISHEIIYDQMIKDIRKNNCSDHILSLIDTITALIINSKLYQEIKPAKDYVLCHGDFNPANITYDKNFASYFLIDWENYGFSLKGYDLANYLAMTTLSFSSIKNDVLPLFFPVDDQEIIEKIFFTYQLLIKWVNQLKKETEFDAIKTNILPAVNDLTLLIENY